MSVVDDVDRYIDSNLATSLDDLKRLCAIPSVSAVGTGLAPAAELVAEMLTDLGFGARLMDTGGAPVVYGDTGGSGKTMICYNHYDVQPPEPLELWTSPPFEPAERNGRLYARGVSDDKGQLLSRLAALRAVRAVTGSLPARIKFVVEGEEEIGSVHLEPFVEHHRDLLASDVCVWETGGVDIHGTPTLTLGMRGICSVELHARSMDRDAHSGFAHVMPNAAWRLVWALASIKGPDERIRIPGFYDDAKPPTDYERDLLRGAPSNEEYTRQSYAIRQFAAGRTGDTYSEGVYNPTCNIAGMGAGWQGTGLKTVTPSRAMAKLDFRLVPDQDPTDIHQKLVRHLQAEGFDDVEAVYQEGERPGTTPPDDPFVQLTARVAQEVYAEAPLIVPMIGGSGPMWAFRHYLDVPIVSLGIADAESNIHAPDESISIQQFVKGTRHMAHLLLAYAG